MRFHYDKNVDALYIRFSEQKYDESDEVADGVILDYDKRQRIIGLEALNASRRFPASLQSAFRARKIPAMFDIVRVSPKLAASSRR